MVDVGSSNHAFGTMSSKIDPSRVVSSIKEDIHAQEIKEVSIVNGEAASAFTPMQWPLFDDGKPISTNAMGYEVGGYYKRHQEAMRMAKAEVERKEEEERIAAARNKRNAPEEEGEREPTVSVEELETIRNAARNEGYTEGLSQGHNEGYKKGVEQGKADGFVQGQQEGLAQGYQDGFRQGRDEGFAKGQEVGIASGSDMVTTQADRFRHLADMLANPIREVDETVTDEIVYIISRLAKIIIKREIKGDVEVLKEGIERCYSMLPEAKEGVQIMLSENDYALMVAAIGRDYMQSMHWDLQPDESLEDGDIVVNTKTSSAQWRIDERIDALISDFLVGAAQAVASARKEEIEGAPQYDEVPKKPIIPPRDILGMSERIAKNMAQMAPRPDFMDEASANLAQAMQQEPVEYTGFDPDATEIQAATMHHETETALRATASAIDAGAAAAPNQAIAGAIASGSALGSSEQIAGAAVPPAGAPQAMPQQQMQAESIPTAEVQVIPPQGLTQAPNAAQQGVVSGLGAAAAVRAAGSQG